MKTAAFHTLGCKVNQYDTQAMLEKFRAAGYEIVPFDADADVYVINTCTVTAVADKKNRNLIRRIRKRSPDAIVGVCGCYAQVSTDAVREMGVDVPADVYTVPYAVKMIREAKQRRDAGESLVLPREQSRKGGVSEC